MKHCKLEMCQFDIDVPALGHYMGKEKIHANLININGNTKERPTFTVVGFMGIHLF